MRPSLVVFIAIGGCSLATWSDTFSGQGARNSTVADAAVGDASTNIAACQGLAASKPPAAITVTFPGYSTGSAHVHIVTSTGTCDCAADTAQDGLVFASDALPCAPLLAPGTPSFAQATATGGGGPNDLTFQWGYDIAATCTITDEYSLAKK